MRWLMRHLLSDADRRAVESDLAELYELRRREYGERAAGRWLMRQHLLYPLHLLVDRATTTLASVAAMAPQAGRDAIYAARSLARTPALTITIALTIGIGLGATAAMIGVVRAVLVNPLPYASPDRLFWIYTDNPPFRFRLSVADYRALEADHAAFASIAAYQTASVTISDAGTAERVTAKSVTGSYFPLLGQAPLLGRLFDESDDTRGDNPVVLTAAYWARRFASDPSVLGRTIAVDGVNQTIVGVLQKDVGPLERNVALFTPARWPAPRRKGPFFTMVLGRLRPDVPQAAALDALRATNRQLFPIWKSSYQDEKATWGLMDLKTRVVGDAGATLIVVLAAVACVLLIACANAINLLIARALDRSRELAIRTALGAPRMRLLQYLVVESALLTAGALLIGVVTAAVSLDLVHAYGGDYVPRIDEVRLSPSLGLWLAALAAGSGLLILLGGFLPALHSSWSGVNRALRSGGRSATDGPAARRWRRGLVSAQFALATPLIVAAVLVMVSLGRLSRVDVGIDTTRMLTAGVSLSGPGYRDDASRKAFWERVVERVGALPGVEAAALADSRPPREAGQTNNFDLEDHPTPAGQNQPLATWVGVSPGFFPAVGLRLERGRLLDSHSLEEGVVVVDRVWAERFFPGQEVLGRRLKSGGCTSCPWTTVVGVVSTVKWVGLEATETGTVYYPFVDLPNAFVVLRTAGDPAAVSPDLRRAIHDLDPGLALTNVATGEELVADALTTPRYLSVLVGMFALAALVLSVVGIYGVMAHFVQQHTRDIGIRLALGGEPSAVRGMVVMQGLRLVAIGVVLGVVAAILGARLLATILFDISSTDATTMLAVPGALLLTAAIACLIPGRRAGRLDPAEILRE
jgi:predicted permease